MEGGPDLRIQQNIDFYILKGDVLKASQKTKLKEAEKGDKLSNRSDFELLKQENQFLKERLNLVLNELEVYRKHEITNSPDHKSMLGKPKKSQITESHNSGISKPKHDISAIRRSIIKKYIKGKNNLTSTTQTIDKHVAYAGSNSLKRDSLQDSTGYQKSKHVQNRSHMASTNRNVLDPLSNFLNTINKQRLPGPSSKQSKEIPLKTNAIKTKIPPNFISVGVIYSRKDHQKLKFLS